MILGKVFGKVSTIDFCFNVSNPRAKKFSFIQINHKEYGFVLCQIVELFRDSQELIAKCNVIGYKDEEGRLKSIRIPFEIGCEVLEAQDEFIIDLIKIDENGALIGTLEGKSIPVHMDLQKILTKHLAILAKSGAGKSYTVGCLLEEIMEKNVPLLVIDPHGEYHSMKNADPSNAEKLALLGLSSKGYSNQIEEYGDIRIKGDVIPLKLNEKMSSYDLMKLLPVNLSNTQESILFSVIKDLDEVNFDNILLALEDMNSPTKWSIMDLVRHLRDLKLFSSNFTQYNDLVKPGKCSIINLKGIEPQVQGMIVSKLLSDLFMERKAGRIPPFFCILEEAHNFVPEKGFGKAKSSQVIRLISSEGRKFGLGLCVISQRPALVEKTVLAQCTTQIIMKITNPNDLRTINGSVEGITPESVLEVQNLPVGSALVCGIVDRPLFVNIRARKSMHGGGAIDIINYGKDSLGKEDVDDGSKSKSSSLVNSESVKSMEGVGVSSGVAQKNHFPQEEQQVDIAKEVEKFSSQNLINVILPKLSVKEIKLMSSREISKITNYLIPCVYFTCIKDNRVFNILVDRIKGKIIIDPDEDVKKELFNVDESCSFFRKPQFLAIEYDVKIEEFIKTNKLYEDLKEFVEVDNFVDCYVCFRKVDYVK
jgi:hypothetical protein